MVTIYYLIIVMLLIAELLYLVNAKEVSKLVIVCRYFYKKDKKKKSLLHSSRYSTIMFVYLFHALYSIFLLFIILVGLFSFQWSFFLLYLFYQGYVGIMIPVKTFNVSAYTKFLKFNTSVQIVFLLFVILNHYQFHLTLF